MAGLRPRTTLFYHQPAGGDTAPDTSSLGRANEAKPDEVEDGLGWVNEPGASQETDGDA